MNSHWILVSAILVALGLPHKADATGAEPTQPTTIFEKSLSSTKKLIVTCQEVPLTRTAQEAADRAAILKSAPGGMLSDHRYTYSYITVTKENVRNVVWTQDAQTFGAIKPGKADESSLSIQVFDAVLQGNMLLVLYQQGRRTEVNFVRLNSNPGVGAVTGSKQAPTVDSKTATQSPFGLGRVLERAGPGDAVQSGHILEPILNEEVTVQLNHVVKQQDGSPRITTYHLVHNGPGREFWTPEPSNTYAPGERPGIEQIKRQP